MNLSSMIDVRLVKFDLEAKDKEDSIRKIANLMYQAEKVTSYDTFLEGVLDRELEFSTGIGMGVAIPHCKHKCVREAAFTLVKLKNYIEWESLDNEPVNFVIMLAAPDSSDNVHLKMLSQLATQLMDDEFREGLLNSKTIEEVYSIFDRFQIETKEKGE